MTKAEFIAAVEAKPNFIKWIVAPERANTITSFRKQVSNLDSDELEHWHGYAHISTKDGTAVFNVWFFVDPVADVATWQNGDSMQPEENTDAKKLAVLEQYITDNFIGGFVTQAKLENNYAEAEVYETGIGKKTILIYKPTTGAITHIDA